MTVTQAHLTVAAQRVARMAGLTTPVRHLRPGVLARLQSVATDYLKSGGAVTALGPLSEDEAAVRDRTLAMLGWPAGGARPFETGELADLLDGPAGPAVRRGLLAASLYAQCLGGEAFSAENYRRLIEGEVDRGERGPAGDGRAGAAVAGEVPAGGPHPGD